METRSKYISIGIAAIAIVGISIGGYAGYYFFTQAHKTPLVVFHAGSLAVPLEYIELVFEYDHPEVDVQLEAGGSSECISWITSGKKADVLASADWSLIPKMDEDYQNYTIQFATNQMVLCYYGELPDPEINRTNFWQYLNESTGWGFSNPNLDPCGYRTLMVLQLAELAYPGNDNILEDLVLAHTDILNTTDGLGNWTVQCPTLNLGLDTGSNVYIKAKSVDLITDLQMSTIEYAFEYRSVAIQHGLKYITLDPELALNETALDDFYNNVKIQQYTSKLITGKSITYGVTVPENADNAPLGALFVEYMINEFGKGVFEWLGQPTFRPLCPTENYGTHIPANILVYCENYTG